MLRCSPRASSVRFRYYRSFRAADTLSSREDMGRRIGRHRKRGRKQEVVRGIVCDRQDVVRSGASSVGDRMSKNRWMTGFFVTCGASYRSVIQFSTPSLTSPPRFPDPAPVLFPVSYTSTLPSDLLAGLRALPKTTKYAAKLD